MAVNFVQILVDFFFVCKNYLLLGESVNMGFLLLAFPFLHYMGIHPWRAYQAFAPLTDLMLFVCLAWQAYIILSNWEIWALLIYARYILP
ncbi:hypothetical protein HJFPF1_04464 [Paramyrothecium foliicola]|nr:hypothetical protein HJFPF1_04464 [Paramyrothecium foliicola]